MIEYEEILNALNRLIPVPQNRYYNTIQHLNFVFRIHDDTNNLEIRNARLNTIHVIENISTRKNKLPKLARAIYKLLIIETVMES